MRFDAARIERELAVVVGKPLWAVSRAADMLACQFGAVLHGVAKYGPRKGQPAECGEFALHVSCSWRLTGSEGSTGDSSATATRADTSSSPARASRTDPGR